MNTKLLTKPIIQKLLENSRNETKDGMKPVVKFFGGSACTWLITEMDEDQIMFGLCDLGFGEPELGYVSLEELMAARFLPFKLPVERDRYFTATKTLTEYADEARECGRIKA